MKVLIRISLKLSYPFQGNLTHLAPNEKFPGIGDGIAKCPFDPDDNATAVWVGKCQVDV